MKRQQLFSSFALASTTAVLATQPVRAENMQVTAVKLNPTASGIEVVLETPSSKAAKFFTAKSGENFVANIFNTQLRFPKGKTFHASNPTTGITNVTVTPLNGNSIRVTVTGKANAPVGKIVQSDKGIVFSLKTNNAIALKRSSSRLSKNVQQRIASTKVAPQPRATVKPAKGNRISQATPPAPAPTSPAAPAPTPRAPVLPTKPLPANPDVRTQSPPPPDYLDPDPNPLQFPTKPEEVQIVGAQPITLQQALDLALRNNRDIQIQQFNLEASEAALRESQAAKYPNVTLGAQITNSDNVFSDDQNFTGSGLTGINTGVTTGTTNPGVTTGVGTGVTTGTTNPGVTTGVGTGVTTGTTNPGVTTGTTNPGVTTGTTNPGVTTGVGTVQPTPEAQTVQQNVNATTPTTGTGQANQLSLQDDTGSTTAFNNSLTISYDLYTSGLRRANIRAAEEQLRFDRLNLESAAEQIRLDVATQYYNLQQADENVRIQRSAVTNAEASLRDAQAREQAGVGTRFEVLQAQVQLAQNTQGLTDALSDQQINRRQLANLLSLPESLTVVTAEPVEIAGLWNLSLPQSIILAYQNRAELQQQLAQRNINQQQRRAALASIGPQVDLSASYNFGKNDLFDDDENFGDDYRIGATVSWLLYDGGEARARARRFDAQARSAEVGFAQQRQQIRFDVEQAYSQLQSSFENIQTTTVALEQAREALRLARLRFQAGVGTQTDVINSEDDLTIAEGQRVNAILSYNRALANLQRSISSGLPR